MIMQVAEWNRANDELIQAKQRSNVEIEVLLKKRDEENEKIDIHIDICPSCV